MATDNTPSVEKSYELFWTKFQLFSISWIDKLLHHPRIVYLLFWGIYGLFLLGMIVDSDVPVKWWRPETIRPWIGDVFIGMAEPHLLTLGVLPVIWASLRWASKIPETFEWLRKPNRRIGSQDNNFDDRYLAYLEDYQRRLLDKKYSAILSLAIIFTVVLFMLGLGFNPVDTFRYIFSNLWTSALLLFLLVWGYFIGLFIWPGYVTLQFIKGLSDHFKIEIQPSHPDKCGGYKPLGDFCFSMSLPVIIGGLVLSFVGMAGLALSVGNAGTNLYMYFGICRYYSTCSFNPFFAYLALVLLVFIFTPLIFITFFSPLWNIHRFMEAGKRVAEDEFANRVAGLEGQIRSHLDIDEGIDKAKIARDKLEIIQSINPNKTGYPVWPFRASLMLTLFSPQIFSIVGFALSIYEAFK
jgi:MFS family permease